MDSVIEYRDTCTESGTFDEVVAGTEQRIAALKGKGFTEAYADIRARTKDIQTGQARTWQVELTARKLDHD